MAFPDFATVIDTFNRADGNPVPDGTVTGNLVSGSPNITSVSDVTVLAVGQYVSGTGIPAATRIISLGINSATMSANATATNNTVTITYAKWVTIGLAAARTQIVSNKLRATANNSNDALDTGDFGPDVEAFITNMTNKPAATEGYRVYARLVQLGSGTVDGYRVFAKAISGAANDEFRIERIDNGSVTLLGSAFPQEFAAGDGLGIKIVGSQISVLRHDGTSWAVLGSVTDATYSAAGRVGVGFSTTSLDADGFGAGTIVAAAAASAGAAATGAGG